MSKVNCKNCMHRKGVKCGVTPMRTWDAIDGYLEDFRPCRIKNAKGDCKKYEISQNHIVAELVRNLFG